MKRFFSQKWVRVTLAHVVLIGVIVGIMLLVSRLIGGPCPTYLLFDVCCPFCGMTRAHLSALRLDFASAFSYHPVFFTGIPFLWLLAHQRLFQKKWQLVLWWIGVGLCSAALAVTYVVRVCTLGFDFFA